MPEKIVEKIKGLIINDKEVKKFVIIFYSIATFGFIFSLTRQLFISLTPYALIINFFLLLFFHREKKNRKNLFIFFSIYILGLTVEIIGVHSGFLFGEYYYGKGLGIKILGTPLLIGLNWLFLVYTTSSVLEGFKIDRMLKVFISSFLMLCYDIILEQLAAEMDMWYWKDNNIPLKNYLAWFIIAFIFHSMIKIFRVTTRNKLASTLLFCQSAFLMILFIFLKLID